MGFRAPKSPRPAPARKTAYTLALSPDLSTATVRVCFTGQPPTRLLPGRSSVANALLAAETLTSAGAVPLPRGEPQISLQAVPSDSCIRYRVALASRDAVPWSKGRLLATTDWLFRAPAAERQGMSFELTLQLPPGIDENLPFPSSAPGRYRLEPDAFLYLSHGVFGTFAHESFEHQASHVEMVYPLDLADATRDALKAQVQRAMDAVATVLGRFPRPRLRLLVVPIRSGSSPAILFGQVSRGGAASVLLLVRDDARLDELESDWTCVHEFAHLFIPFIRREDAWLSEGLSTYYQEVLRARVGLRTPTQAWRRLLQGAQRALRTTEPLIDQSRHMHQRHNYPDVYWGGAVYALAVDVALREQSAQALSLDRVLERLGPADAGEGAIRASDLLQRLDRATAGHLFTTTAQQLVYGPATGAHRRIAALIRRLGLVDCDPPLRSADPTIQGRAEQDGLNPSAGHALPACELSTAPLALHPAPASATRNAIVAPND